MYRGRGTRGLARCSLLATLLGPLLARLGPIARLGSRLAVHGSQCARSKLRAAATHRHAPAARRAHARSRHSSPPEAAATILRLQRSRLPPFAMADRSRRASAAGRFRVGAVVTPGDRPLVRRAMRQNRHSRRACPRATRQNRPPAPPTQSAATRGTSRFDARHRREACLGFLARTYAQAQRDAATPPRTEAVQHAREHGSAALWGKRGAKKKGAAAFHRCAQNEHDRPTVGFSIPYACA